MGLILAVRLLTYWNSRRIAAEFPGVVSGRSAHGQADRLFARHGTDRPSYVRTPSPPYERAAANELWLIDSRVRSSSLARTCHFVALVDDHSRFRLGIRAVPSKEAMWVLGLLEEGIELCGVPHEAHDRHSNSVGPRSPCGRPAVYATGSDRDPRPSQGGRGHQVPNRAIRPPAVAPPASVINRPGVDERSDRSPSNGGREPLAATMTPSSGATEASIGYNFRAVERDQEYLMPPSLRDWLPEDDLAWVVLDAVAEMDLGPICARYRSDGWGAPAFHRAMMTALLLYAYATGSARRAGSRAAAGGTSPIGSSAPTRFRSTPRLAW